jgi:hypothetical protein
VLNSDQQHAISQAVTPAIQFTVAQLPSSGREQDEWLAIQASEVFSGPLAALAGQLHHDVTQLQGRRIERALPNWGTRCRR